jgi:hypothetical protein
VNHIITPATFDRFSEAFKQLTQLLFELGNHFRPLRVYDQHIIEKLLEIPVDKSAQEPFLVYLLKLDAICGSE